jgi:lysozyme
MMKRTHIAALVLSASALVGIATHESYRGEAYIPVPGDVPTLGFGTTDKVKMGDKITPERALIRLLADANNFERAVKSCVTVPLYQHEYDAYLSLTYNIGPSAFCKSTLVKKANAGDYTGACNEILRWNKAGGKVLNGLVKRRQAEHATCMGLGIPYA